MERQPVEISLLEKPRREQVPWRVHILNGDLDLMVPPAKSLEESVRGLRGGLAPSLPEAIGVRETSGSNPLMPRSSRKMVELVDYGMGEPERIDALRRMAVKYVIVAGAGQWTGGLVRAGPTRIYEIPKTLSTCTVEPRQAGRILGVPINRPGRWRVDLEMYGAAKLIIRETGLRGWIVDEHPDVGMTVKRTREGWISVPLPAGKYAVGFRYDPWSASIGTLISFSAIGVLLLRGTASRHAA